MRRLILLVVSISLVLTGAALAQRLDGGVRLNGALTALGLGAAALPTTGLYINNLNGVGLHIKGGSASNTRSAMVIEASNGLISTMFDAQGALYTLRFLVVSGSFSATQDGLGNLTVFTPGTTGLSDMIDVVGDTAFGVVSKASPVPGHLYTGLDHNGNTTFDMDELGNTTFGTFKPAGFIFANIATKLTADGVMGFCSDCTIANPCAGGGSGALAKRLNGVNVCN